jgi:hypothetical protein
MLHRLTVGVFVILSLGWSIGLSFSFDQNAVLAEESSASPVAGIIEPKTSMTGLNNAT